jgi:hypothetical protein
MEEFEVFVDIIIVGEGIQQNSRNWDISRKCELYIHPVTRHNLKT